MNEKDVKDQCDQIGRYIALWGTFQSLWQQLCCPNRRRFSQFWLSCQNLSFWGNFYRNLAPNDSVMKCQPMNVRLSFLFQLGELN